jgi:hypothetical protein
MADAPKLPVGVGIGEVVIEDFMVTTTHQRAIVTLEDMRNGINIKAVATMEVGSFGSDRLVEQAVANAMRMLRPEQEEDDEEV